ncbi:MAG: transcriptional repressor [Ruminococcaceae bacterium]|nr:transcriptional repressor [Oscillospiraceae bacterium]
METRGYNTKQRMSLLNIFKECPQKCFSAKELIRMPEVNLGEATVYRTLSKFEKEGLIKKYIGSNSEGALYQYSENQEECNHHFHLKCTGCGTLIHMDCHLMDSFKDHIKDEHKFFLDIGKTTLYGLCDNCNGK